ncbi:MAG: right-handed parallel beta-helix repeat-containing protein [Pirellulales bacterium]|nr:right-handed parallel beta-helix repeat-containing protein [Pirellulales bacterium]
MKVRLICWIVALATAGSARGEQPAPEAAMTKKNPVLVRQVEAGQRDVANAAWWGFDEKDATPCLQAAIRSGVKKLIVPNLGKPWIVAATIHLVSDQEIEFEAGVVVVAMQGKFLDRTSPLFLAADKRNLTLRGEGAAFRMHKEDYSRPPYEKAEWRHTLSLVGCTNVKVFGLTLRDSGGDGIYLGTTKSQNYCRDIHIQGVTCDNHHRQGISVISAMDLLIENCRLLNTGGTPPAAGIDLEPNAPEERLVNCLVRGCVAENNAGGGFFVYLKPLSSLSPDVSVRFEDCVVRGSGGFGLGVGAVKGDGPGGTIEFANMTVEGTDGPGAYVYDKSAERTRVRFVRCTWKNVARKQGHPVELYLRRPQLTTTLGGVDFDDCTIIDDRDRPFLAAAEKESDFGVTDIKGSVHVDSPAGSRVDLGPKPTDVELKVTYTADAPEQEKE